MMTIDAAPSPNLFIRYKGEIEAGGSSISLAELGVSLTGFDAVFKEFVQILRIDIEPEIEATATREGSFIVDIAAWWKEGTDSLPFHSVEDFLSFLRLAGDPMLEKAEAFFNVVLQQKRTLNDWVSANPADCAVLGWLFTKVVKVLMRHAANCKNKITEGTKAIPKRIQIALQKMIKKRGFKKALSPMTENKISQIEISDEPEFKEPARIDQKNLSQYLADDDTILPHLQNGKHYDLNGIITSLKATRGDRLTLQITHNGTDYNLDCLPAIGQTSKSYIEFYQEHILVNVEVLRTSLYKKPKLRLLKVEFSQMKLNLDVMVSEEEVAAESIELEVVSINEHSYQGQAEVEEQQHIHLRIDP